MRGRLGLVVAGWLTAALLVPSAAATNAWLDEHMEITVSPASGSPGAVITLTGTGWNPENGDVDLYPDISESFEREDRLVTAEPDPAGTFSVTFAVPDREEGDYRLYACQGCDESGRTGEASASFTITSAPVLDPRLTLTPLSGAVGDSIVAEGTGWGDRLGEVTLFTVTTEPEGRIELATAPVSGGGFATDVEIPELPLGAREIIACQVCEKGDGAPNDTVVFTVVPPTVPLAPTLALLPEAGQPGDDVEVTGVGWNDDLGPVSVYADPGDLEDGAAPLDEISTTDGSFEAVLSVPDREPGDYTWLACQRCFEGDRLEDEAAFTIQSPPPPPGERTLTLRPTSAAPGTTVQVSGTGWDPSRAEVLVFSDEDLSFESDRALLFAPVTDDGTFEGTFVVEDDQPGEFTFYACQACASAEPLSAVADFELVAATPTPAPAGWSPLLTTALVVLVLLVVAALLQQQVRRRTRRRTQPRAPAPALLAHPDLSFDVAHVGPHTGTVPTLRLVPHRDEADPHRVEMR